MYPPQRSTKGESSCLPGERDRPLPAEEHPSLDPIMAMLPEIVECCKEDFVEEKCCRMGAIEEKLRKFGFQDTIHSLSA